jgi:predicted membrane channel-forming protein YqfA (hemolysin III family)
MSENVYRWSGILLIAGAALLGIAIVTISLKPVTDQPLSPSASLILFLASLLLLLSLPAMYARQANAAGWLGLAGHALLQSGVVFLVMISATPILYPSFNETPGESAVAFMLGIALTLGLLLTGVATIRAEVFPRWAGILLLLAMAGFFFDFFVAEFLPPIAGQIGSAAFGVVLALAFAWIGVDLWIGKLGPAIGRVTSTR